MKSPLLKVTVLVLGLLLCTSLPPSRFGRTAASGTPLSRIGRGPITEGCLVTTGDQPLLAPLRATNVQMNITGFIADVSVEQTFYNPSGERIEAVYIFPLPSDAAVNDLDVRIGGRTITSQVKRRAEATRIYENARNQGRQGALLEQERANVFTASVGNINPDEEIRVRIRYLQRLAYDDGGFKVQFPMVVAPRYIPGEPIGKLGTGWSFDTTQVPDASRITPPVLPPDVRPGNNISLNVTLDAGFPVNSIRSLQHQVNLVKTGASRYEVTLASADEIPNRDFILEYRIADARPRAAMIVSPPVDGASYFVMMAMPPAEVLSSDARSKEMIFVIDTSGSMEGPKIIQARNALRTCLHGLNPQDSFNIIRFSSDFSVFAQASVPFTQDNVDRADSFIDRLRAGGGTEIIPPLLHALRQPSDESRLRTVVFITDAEVGNDAEALRAVTNNLGDSRVFTFGIDTAPNDYLMKKLAQFGRGAFEFVTPKQNIEDVIGRFQNRISLPVLSGVQVKWSGLTITDTFPKLIPDLYAAQPVVMYGRLTGRPEGRATLVADSRNGTVSLPLDIEVLPQTKSSNVLAAMWARSSIDDLSDRLVNEPNNQNLIEQITDLAINFKLMSQFTSFVAVEERMEVPAEGGPPRRVVVPVPLPDSWDYNKVFGGNGNAGQDLPLKARLGRASANLGAHSSVPPPPPAIPSPADVNRLPSNITADASTTRDSKGARKDAAGSSGSYSPSGVVGGVPNGPPPPLAQPKTSANAGSGSALKKEDTVSLDGNELRVNLTASSTILADRLNATAHFLVRQQSVAGWWGEPSAREDIDTTALALLGYLSSGYTDRSGSYQAQVQRALQTLISHVDGQGVLHDDNRQIASTRSHALVLWAVSEAAYATRSDRYRSVVDRLATHLIKLQGSSGLWHSNDGGSDIQTSDVVALSLASAQKAGVTAGEQALKTLAFSIDKADSVGVDQWQHALIKLLAGQNLSAAQRSNLTADLARMQLSVADTSAAEKTTMILFTARLLDQRLAENLAQKLLPGAANLQVQSGKQSGAFAFGDNRPVVGSARIYVLLNVSAGRWAIYQ